MKVTPKKYECSQCGHVVTQETNHYQETWSHGRYNTCPKCPPFRKYPEFGGQTIWKCLEKPPAQLLNLRDLLVDWLNKFPQDACDPDLTQNAKAGYCETPDGLFYWASYGRWDR